MSSTERAPEPTMEEILASIRRIITDDEAGQGKTAKPAQRAQSEDESLEGEADNQIIDDIARVLSGSAAPADEEEEILDLTAELGGLEIVEDDEPVFEIDEEEVVEVLELEEIVEAAPEEEAFEPSAGLTDEAPALEEALAPDEVPEQPEPAEEPEMAMPAPPPQPPQPEPQPEAPKLSASEEAASALERAIAALRAGQVPTSTTPQAEPFQFQAAPQPEAMTAPEQAEPEPLPMAEPMPEPEPFAETHSEPEAYFEPEGEASIEAEPEEGEPELLLAEIEETIEFSEPEPEPEPEQEAPPFWRAETAAEPPSEPEPVHEPEPESVAAQMNGGAHHDVAGKTLEEQVKDMLRPMLRQWLDENMPRIVREMDPDALRRNLD